MNNLKKLTLILLLVFVYYFIALPPLNLQSPFFYVSLFFNLVVIYTIILLDELKELLTNPGTQIHKIKNKSKIALIMILLPIIIFIGITFINFILSPLFIAQKYSARIEVIESKNFNDDIEEFNYNNIALLDRDSTSKLGDRTLGKLPELVSQYDVSNTYTQIKYKNSIERVTPLEYDDLIKSFTNRKEGITGYIRVNSVTGKTKLERLDKGIKYAHSAPLMRNLYRKIRFSYPYDIFGDFKFEIDDNKNPYWIVPVLKHKGIGLMTDVSHVIIFNPINGESEKHKIKDVPKWVDQVYEADIIMEQLGDWGKYKGGFINATIGQKNVVKPTEGYNYLIKDDGIYLTTGVTSKGNDSSNLGFILTNLRTKETTFYKQSGAEEYSAMESAKGKVQQMNYKPTFPILINLKGKPTYIISLKDKAGLVKMYAFVDVEDYQKVSVTDVSKGLKKAADNYLSLNKNNDKTHKKEITIKTINQLMIDGNTFFYITDTDGNKYKASITLNDELLPFIKENENYVVKYKEGILKEITSIK